VGYAENEQKHPLYRNEDVLREGVLMKHSIMGGGMKRFCLAMIVAVGVLLFAPKASAQMAVEVHKAGYPITDILPFPVKIMSSSALTGSVSITNWPSSYAVTGTFWPTTQPISGNVGITGSVGVTGTFWQATQPVSGTFWQATQPVSIATMPTTPVTGTFWPDTQPISGSVSVSNFPATQTVSGTVTTTISDSTYSDSVVDVTLSDTGTVYSYTLPSTCVMFEFQCRTATDILYSNNSAGITGGTGYRTLKSGTSYNSPGQKYAVIGSKTLFWKSPATAGAVLELTIWTK
jgi:hypothetical protein